MHPSTSLFETGSQPSPATGSLKKRLRRDLLATRRQLSRDDWQARNDRLADRLQSIPEVASARTMLAYCSINQEPDLMPLMVSGWGRDRRWGLPRCRDRALIWHEWQAADPLETGAFGIQEPLATTPNILPETVDLILVPAVACDRQGYRLGYGSGFYDRLLAQPQWQQVRTLAIVFDFAWVDRLPRDPWDRPLAGVCTDSRWCWFDRNP